jgi:ABC-type antimicrobial peptide transport system permease subunit
MKWFIDIASGAKNGLAEIWSNKVRSLLSMSGIVLGVAALVAMVGIVQGMLGNMRASFERGGGILKLEVHSAEAPESQQHIAGISPGLTWWDGEAIRRSIPLALFVNPVIDMRWERFVHKGQRRGALLMGVTPDMRSIQDRKLAQGRFISDTDIQNKSPVIVIGEYLRRQYFEEGAPSIGEQVAIRGQLYTIVGVTAPVATDRIGGGGWNREQRLNFIPATTAMARYKGNDEIDRIEILARKTGEIPDLIAQIENTLTQTHRGIRDFEVRTQDEQLQELKKLERSFTYSMGGIAAISLLVGGIGIMNVMLASVSERIREIGVRKAIGARSHDIFIQFLAEAVVISVLGGLLGLVASVGLLALAKEAIPQGDNIGLIPLGAMVVGFLFSSGIGLISGIYPAMRAARLDPIDALRYE